jgi:D-glycerate 3-kinase
MVSESSPQFPLRQILLDWIASQPIADRPFLEAQLLHDADRATAFGITPANVANHLDQRLHWLRSSYAAIDRFCRTTLGWTGCSLEWLWNVGLPIAMQLANWRQMQEPCLMVGMLGGQGTGKTTLSRILAEILAVMDLCVCRLSIDDLYKTYAERQQLQQADPRFRWRGPPGTHDVELGLSVLHQLRSDSPHQSVAIPRFDKSLWAGAGDRTDPEIVTGADIVLFEGWFVGVRPVDPAAFETAPAPIVAETDRAFAREINDRLVAYLPLWQQLDRLMVLCPTDYHFSQQWRRQAEHQMMAAGRSGMTDAEIDEFVEYFWRSLHPELFITPLLRDPHTDLVIELDINHQPVRIYNSRCRNN